MEVLLARWPKYLDNSNIELFIRDDTSLPDLQFINVVQNVFDPPPLHFEHFDGLGATFHCCEIGQYKAQI